MAKLIRVLYNEQARTSEGLNPVSFVTGIQLWQRPSGRHGRHARGSDVRSGSVPSLSIRSAEVRNWSADLSGPGPAGLVLYGLAGIGKSTLAAQIATRVRRLRSEHVVTTLSGEVSAGSFPASPTATDFIILDNFDDNLTQQAVGWTVRDPILAALLATWPGKLLITCRRPFVLGNPRSTPAAPSAGRPATATTSRPILPAGVRPTIPAPRRSSASSINKEPPGQGIAPAARARPGRDRLVFRQLGPLTRSGAWEITSSLPAVRLLPDAERDYLWRITAGHPRALEDLDSALGQGAHFSDLADRIEAMVKARSGQALPRTEPTGWPEATAALVASAAGDQLIGELFASLSAGARTLLVRASVFRVHVGSEVLAARPGQLSEVQAAGLLAVGPDGTLSVHRWTADRLHRCLADAGLGAQVVAAHEQAARYWRTRSASRPAGERADLEAAYHERHATVASPAEGTARRQFGPPTVTKRRRVIGISVASAITAGAVFTAVLAIQATQGAGASHLASSDVAAATAAPVTEAALVRGQAAAWAAQQVSGGAIIACDPAMCAVLARHGVAAGNLLELGPAALDPLGSEVVFATAAVRSMFGGRLASVYAPEILASFGSGQARIDVRAVAPDGAAAYRVALAADLQARRVAGAQLLHNPRITFSVSARAQLLAGQVDARLLITLDPLAASEPVQIDAFLAEDPGASPGLPLRAVQLSAAPGPAQRILAFFRAQRTPYLAAHAALTSSGGVTVQFAAPAPLGLLQPSP
jgi:hypothetical protein